MYEITFSRGDAPRIAAARASARRRCLRIEKSRGSTGLGNLGGLRVTDFWGHVVAGADYGLDLRDVHAEMRDWPTKNA